MRAAVLPVAVLAFVSAACVESNRADIPASFEEWEAIVPRIPQNGAYLVEGDLAIHGKEALRAYWDTRVVATREPRSRSGALIVDTIGINGPNNRWPDAQKRNLTYCVSTAFGGNYDLVVSSMAQATGEWAAASDVRFAHRGDQDGACDNNNTNVVFDVRFGRPPNYPAGVDGISFFPSQTRGERTLWINDHAFTHLACQSVAGLLRHELGHTLGFRHENIRPGAITNCNDPLHPEPTNWRELTPYDHDSVMHYGDCTLVNGEVNYCGDPHWQYYMSDRDRAGAAALYGAPNTDPCDVNPNVGPGNGNAMNAGYLDYQCGYSKYYGGGVNGACSSAVTYARAAGTYTAATGTCYGGTQYNFYAGLYNYYCRYYEYYGYGWDYNGYCSQARSYAQMGSCYQCNGSCTPNCWGKTCGQDNGCGTGTCCVGSGCNAVGCGECNTQNSCGSGCTPVADGTACSTGTCQNGTCVNNGTARTIWIQPAWRAGFGPSDGLTVAGSATGCTSVDLWYYNPAYGAWQHVDYVAPVGSDGIWYNSIRYADFYATYYVYAQCHNGNYGPMCIYDGRNDIVWCP